MSNHGLGAVVAESANEGEGVAYHAEQSETLPIAVVIAIPPGRATVSSLVRSHHMKPGLPKGNHHLPPAECQLRKAVQEHEERSPEAVETCFEDVCPEARPRLHKPGPHSGGQMLLPQRDRKGIRMVDRMLGPWHVPRIPTAPAGETRPAWSPSLTVA